MKSKILILTRELDLHADDMVLTLNRRGIKPFRFHPKDFPSKALIGVRNTTVTVKYPGGKFSSDDIRSVWNRRPDRCFIPATMPGGEREFSAKESNAALENAFALLGTFWVNRPEHNLAANIKLSQLQEARRCGLDIPDTLATNDPKEFLNFYKFHDGNVIIKTHRQGFISTEKDVVVYTSVVDAEKAKYAMMIKNCPCLFQANIPKVFELRITVIGRRIFAAALYSQGVDRAKTDWRMARPGSVPIEPYDLPDEVSLAIGNLMQKFNLNYAAIDMIVNPRGEHVFLEINPNGQFGWLDSKKLPLYETMADMLIAGSRDF